MFRSELAPRHNCMVQLKEVCFPEFPATAPRKQHSTRENGLRLWIMATFYFCRARGCIFWSSDRPALKLWNLLRLTGRTLHVTK